MTVADRILDQMTYRFAGERHVAGIQRHYVRFFSEIGAGSVLDLACGRGIFLDLLREAGIQGVGVDQNRRAVEECRSRGLDRVELGDLFAHLQREIAAGTHHDGVFCSHLVEHLTGQRAAELVGSCAALLAPGGRVVIVTPNVANLKVWTKVFWLDPTHERPYPRAILEAMMEEAGLTVVRSFDDPRTRPHHRGRDPVGILPDLLRFGLSAFAGMDSVVVGERTA